MHGKAALLGFLVLQAAAVAIWLFSLLPLTQAGAPPFVSHTAQIWSGGAEANIVENWRQQTTTEMAAPYKATGPLLTALALMIASIAPVIAAWALLRRGQVWLAVGGVAVTLACGAGAAWFIVQQWNGSTMFPPGFPNTGWLYMSTRAFLMQMLLAWVVLVAFLGLVIADIAKPDRTLGFGWAAANWVIVAAIWIGLYLGMFLAPLVGGA